MQQIVDAARYFGWSVFHVFDSRRSAPGFPDLICAKEGRMLAIEVKTEKGKVSPHQAFWLDVLGTVPGVTAMVARPSGWEDVERALRGE